jgi:hypothetical protein
MLYPHHQESIQRVRAYFQEQPEVLAVLLGGSLAHGFAQETSDIDIMIIVSPEEHQRRFEQRALQFFDRALCTYPDGYVDGKYISVAFLDQVERRGSEPARFAFQDSQALFSRIGGLEKQIQRIARYPVEEQTERICRFHAQFQAWHWYVSEAEKKGNHYLKGITSHKLILFGGRMLLAHNQMLYPYHKWLLAVLERAPLQPAGLMEAIQRLSQQPSLAHATHLYELISGFRTWEADAMPWPNRFMLDSELNWMDGPTPIDDL